MTAAVITTTSVVSGSVSARAFSSIARLCGERIATSLRYGLVIPRLAGVTSGGRGLVELLEVLVVVVRVARLRRWCSHSVTDEEREDDQRERARR